MRGESDCQWPAYPPTGFLCNSPETDTVTAADFAMVSSCIFVAAATLLVIMSCMVGSVSASLGALRTAKILPPGVRMYTPLGVLITSTFSPAGIRCREPSADVLLGIGMSETKQKWSNRAFATYNQSCYIAIFVIH